MTSIQEHWRCSCLGSSRASVLERDEAEVDEATSRRGGSGASSVLEPLPSSSSPSLLLLDASRRPPASPTIDRSASPH